MYNPGKSLPTGKNQVEITCIIGENFQEHYKWNFSIQPVKLIQSVEHDANHELSCDEVVNVTVKGKANCRGTFDIDVLHKNLQLSETSPGVYKGSYKVSNGDYLQQGYILSNLESPDGTVSIKQSIIPLDIDTKYFRSRIITPRNYEKVGRNFEVRGRTRPHHTVYISSQLGLTIAVKSPMGSTATRQVVADDKGFFSYKYFFPITMKGLTASIMIHAVDDKGNRSIPDQVVILIEGEEKNPMGNSSLSGSK
jgi:hypothetical protein